MVLHTYFALTTTLSSSASTFTAFTFSSRSNPFAVPLVAATCAAFALSALLLIPADAAAASSEYSSFNNTSPLPPAKSLVSFWRALYWVALLLGWLASETLCELLVAGEFSRTGRLKSAVRSSVRLYAIVALLGLAGCLYLLFWLHVPFSELPSLAALLVNGHGLLVLSLLIGHGLVELPRRLWHTAPPRSALAQRYFALALADDARSAAATRLRQLLQKVSAADAAAAPPNARGPRERLCWDALLRTGRSAAQDCKLEEHEGGSLTWGLRSAWAHTLGTPRARDEASLAKLRRRVRVAGGQARRAWQSRQIALHAAADLCERLTANEKGFGGAGVARSRGLWLGMLRKPTVRALAALAAGLSAWLLLNEACGLVRLLPPPYSHTLPAYCPAPLLDAAIASRSSSAAYFLDVLILHYMAYCAHACLQSSRMLAQHPLIPWRGTDGVALLRHAAWAIRLAGPLAARFLLLSTSQPAESAFASALGSRWQLPQKEKENDAASAMGYHGLCSLLTLLTAGCTLFGICGCGALLGATVDPTCRRYTGKSSQRSTLKRGERITRQHLAQLGAVIAAGGDGALSRSGCGGGDGGLSYGAGLGGAPSATQSSGAASLLGAASSLGGAGLLGGCAPSLLDDEQRSDDELEDEDDEDGSPRGGRRQQSPSTPGGTPSSLAWPTPPRTIHGSGGGAGASSSGGARGGGGRGRGRGRGGDGRGSSSSRRKRADGPVGVWSRLLAAHGGGAAASSLSEGTEDDASSDGGGGVGSGGDEEGGDYYSSLPRWAARTRPKASGSSSGMASAKRVWDAISKSPAERNYTLAADGDHGESSGSTAAPQRWCELTPCTGTARPSSSDGEGSSAAWRELRAQAGASV